MLSLPGSIPGQRTKIPQATGQTPQHPPKKKTKHWSFRDKMTEKKDMSSSFLIRTSKSQLTAEKPLTEKKKPWNLPKKISYIQTHSSRHNEAGGRDTIIIKLNHIPARWATHKRENNYNLRFSRRGGSSAPHVWLTSLGI